MGHASREQAECEAQEVLMRGVFLDTSAWVSAAISNQTHHAAARSAYTNAVRQGFRIVTTPMVLGEAHALFLRILGRERARAAIRAVQADPTHVVMPVDEDLVSAAVERWIDRFEDQSFSLCDAVSFEVMRVEKLTRALTIDRHFQTAGFETLL